jgi:hypothetical protein
MFIGSSGEFIVNDQTKDCISLISKKKYKRVNNMKKMNQPKGKQ